LNLNQNKPTPLLLCRGPRVRVPHPPLSPDCAAVLHRLPPASSAPESCWHRAPPLLRRVARPVPDPTPPQPSPQCCPTPLKGWWCHPHNFSLALPLLLNRPARPPPTPALASCPKPAVGGALPRRNCEETPPPLGERRPPAVFRLFHAAIDRRSQNVVVPLPPAWATSPVGLSRHGRLVLALGHG
jgi:hypothetical protein